MLAHNIKAILTIAPEAKGLVKQANLEEDFPVDSPDSASASYLRVEYLTKVAGQVVQPETVRLVQKAASLYGVKEKLDTLLPRFSQVEKKASESDRAQELEKVAGQFDCEFGTFGFLDIEKAASVAEEVYSQYGDEVVSEGILRYAGVGYLNKEAAVKTLANRYLATDKTETGYLKIARLVLDNVSPTDIATVRKVCKTVSGLDKQAGLDILGFNFYKEALIMKQAEFNDSVQVELAGEKFPYSQVCKLDKSVVASTLGKDVAGHLNDDPMNNKAVYESLPRDLQLLAKSVLKGIK